MVENVIYYFSGTGNSLDIAKHIAEELKDTVLISMGNNPFDVKQMSSIRVGFVYPVYYGGMPTVVEQFIKHIRINHNIYVFAIATGRSHPGNALKQMRLLFESEDHHLSYSAFVKMVDNNIIEYIGEKKTEALLANSYAQLTPILRSIKECQSNRQGLWNPIVNSLHQIRMKKAKNWEDKFIVNDQCNHCGICRQVCPVANIDLVDGKPLFLHHCEACMACIHYCPQKAINYGKQTCNKPRYHHPNITVEDLSQRWS